MKKIIKTLFVFILSMAIYNAVSAASLTISPTEKTIKPGETVNLTAGVVDAAGWDIKVTTSGGTLSGNIEDADSSGTQTSKTVLTPTFTASAEGTYTITVKGELTYDDPSSDLGISKKTASATATITVVEPPVQEEPKEETPTETPKEETPVEQPKEETPTETPKEETPAEQPKEETPKEEPKEEPKQEPEEPVLSSNNKLKMLGIKPNDFRNFKSGTTTYYITVPNEVSEVEVYAEKQEDAQKISGTGMVDLDVGKNTVRVVCTAENGTTKTYTMYITREEKVEEPEVVEEPEEEPTVQEEEPQEEPETFEEKILGITKLNILAKTEEGKDLQVELNPAFEETTSEYAVAVPLTVKDIDVSVEAGTQTAEIELMGNKNLIEGKNVVTAIVKIGKETKVYQITVNKIEMVETSALSNELIMQLAVIAAIATAIIVAIVAIIVAIATSKKKDKKREPVNYTNTEISTQQTNVEQPVAEEPKKEE